MKTKKLTGLTMFDIAKGVGIILVVLLHSNSGGLDFDGVAFNLLRSVLMPLFFLISGYWLKKKKILKGIKYSAQYVLKPYLISGVCIVLLSCILKLVQGKNPVEYMIYQAGAFLFGFTDAGGTMIGSVCFGWNGALWFLLALFEAWCLFYLVININNELLQRMCVLVMVLTGSILSRLNIIHFFDIPQALIAIGYIYIGYTIKKYDKYNKKIEWYEWIVYLFLWIGSAYFGFIDLASLTIEHGILDIAGSIAGAFVVSYCFLWVNRLTADYLNIIGIIGRYTNWILCIHTVEMLVFPWDKINEKLPSIDVANINIIQFVIRSLFIFAVCVVLKKWPNYLQILHKRIKNKKVE